MDADDDLDELLAGYYRMCTDAGVEPLPDDEAREQARRFTALLGPAFAITLRQH